MFRRQPLFVIPAKAGIPFALQRSREGTEIPAFAGMTKKAGGDE